MILHDDAAVERDLILRCPGYSPRTAGDGDKTSVVLSWSESRGTRPAGAQVPRRELPTSRENSEHGKGRECIWAVGLGVLWWVLGLEQAKAGRVATTYLAVERQACLLSPPGLLLPQGELLLLLLLHLSPPVPCHRRYELPWEVSLRSNRYA